MTSEPTGSAIAVLFDEEGRQASDSTWVSVDRLEELFPEPIAKIKSAKTDIECDPLLIELLDQVASSVALSDNEKYSLSEFLWGLRIDWIGATRPNAPRAESARRLQQGSEALGRPSFHGSEARSDRSEEISLKAERDNRKPFFIGKYDQ